MIDEPLKYNLMFVYNQSAICLPKPQGFKDLAFQKMYGLIFV